MLQSKRTAALRTAAGRLPAGDAGRSHHLLFDINKTLVGRDLPRIEETVRPAILSGMLSDVLTASMAKHSRALTSNGYHNGHPDLIPAAAIRTTESPPGMQAS